MNFKKEGICMKRNMKRAIITLAVFVVIYVATPMLIAFKDYDLYMDAIRVLGAIIGAGCYWIGSNEHPTDNEK